MSRSRAAFLVGLMLLLSASGCSRDSSPQGQMYTVLVDGHTADNRAAFSGFFPKAVVVHAGDTVAFRLLSSGLPHTVALGRAVDTALTRIEELAATDPDALRSGPPPEYAAVPQLLVKGAADVNQAAAQPCVVDGKATIPTREACPGHDLKTYDGRQQLASSGWLAAGQTWRVRISPSTKPGTYRFLCQVHGPDMAGAIRVVTASTQVKDPAAVAVEANAARLAVLQRLQPGFTLLRSATAQRPLAGSGDPNAPDALVVAFGPDELHVPVGRAVSWTVIGTHGIAFNAPPDAVGLRRLGSDGAVHLSERATSPAGGAGAGPAVQQPPPVIDGGSWDGVGFRSSGIIFGPPPPHPTQYRLRFTRPGRYAYVCTVHPDMRGTVVVTGP